MSPVPRRAAVGWHRELRVARVGAASWWDGCAWPTRRRLAPDAPLPLSDTVRGVTTAASIAPVSPRDRPPHPRPAVRLADLCDREQLLTDIDDGLISVRPHPEEDLWILNYTPRAQYGGRWSEEIRLCRGLIIRHPPTDPDAEVVARPFAKFANAGEHGPGTSFGLLPTHLGFEVCEKVDGSLAIAYPTRVGPAIATRGSFTSDQAVAATALLRTTHPELVLPEGVTLLFEYVAPWNRIVVDYGPCEELVALAAIDVATGADVDFPAWDGRHASRFDAVGAFAELAEELSDRDVGNAEGVVVRFVPLAADEPSVRVKLKYPEYLRLHRLVTGLTTTLIWEHLGAGRSVEELVEAVPDEFYAFVTATVTDLMATHDTLVSAAADLAAEVADLPRREAAAIVTAQRAVPPSLVFAALDGKDVAAKAWKLVRPEIPEHYPGWTRPDPAARRTGLPPA